MMRKPSMKQAEWIATRVAPILGGPANADDVFDVLTGQITSPADFVSDVMSLAIEYDDLLRRGNARKD